MLVEFKTEWGIIPSLTFLTAKVVKIPIKGNSKDPYPSIWLIRILMCWDGEDGERGVVDVRDLGEVEGDAVEKEVGVSGSVVDADEALEILVESLRLGVALPAVEVPQNGGGV